MSNEVVRHALSRTPSRWRISSRSQSNAGANCVEVGAMGTGIALRDSKVPTGPILTAPATDWQAMLTAIKDGDLDA